MPRRKPRPESSDKVSGRSGWAKGRRSADGALAALPLPRGQPHRRHVAVAEVVAVQGRDLDRRAALRGMHELAVAGIDADVGEGAAVAEEDEVSALEVAARDRHALARHVVRHARDALSEGRAVEVVDKAAAVE